MKRLGYLVGAVIVAALVMTLSLSVDAKRKKNNDFKLRQYKMELVQRPSANAVSSALTEVRINSRYRNVKKQYTAMTVNFNPSYRVPNCVSYVLTRAMCPRS